jgi:hypothetical protein
MCYIAKISSDTSEKLPSRLLLRGAAEGDTAASVLNAAGTYQDGTKRPRRATGERSFERERL